LRVMSKKKKTIFWIIQLSLIVGCSLIPLVAGIRFVGLFMSGIAFPIQDCEGLHITLSGAVREASGTPIADAEVQIRSLYPEYYGNPPTQTLTTDNEGNFREEDFLVFLCDRLMIETSADGFEPITTEVLPFGRTPMVEDFSIQPVPVEVEIILERTP
jgi:hypothetical protein